MADIRKAPFSNTMLRYMAANVILMEPWLRKTAVGARAPYFIETPERRVTRAALESSRQSAWDKLGALLPMEASQSEPWARLSAVRQRLQNGDTMDEEMEEWVDMAASGDFNMK